MKWYLDWLFVRGVNLIYPHAFYYSMRGRRKEERPPEVGMHSGFWEDYKTITDYIKRMSWLMTDCTNQAQIAILCSFDKLSWQAARPLFEHQMEFNYLEEELLPKCKVRDGMIQIADQSYRILVKDKEYDARTEQYLEEFQKQGVFVIDLWKRQQSKIMLKDQQKIDSEEWIKELEGIYRPDFIPESYVPGLRYTHIKKKEAEFILVTNEGEKPIKTKICIPGKQITEVWDAESGTIEDSLKDTKESYELNLARRKSLIFVVED